MKKYFTLLLLITGSLTACKKGASPTPGTPTPSAPIPINNPNVDVYVAGITNAANGKSVSTYWKNGVAVKLGDSSISTLALGIAINGSDVYVVGYSDADGKMQAQLWKNGVIQALTDNSGSASVATGITIGNGTIYISGCLLGEDGSLTSVYWKNGIMTKLGPSGPYFTYCGAIMVNNTDVYVAGQFGDFPMYWKNGTVVKPVDTSLAGYETGIAIQGSDVYLCGIGITNYTNYTATLLKNGVSQKLTDNALSSMANGICLNGADVYVVGMSGGSQYYSGDATYWKNGVQHVIAKEGAEGIANAIAINDNDVYIAGTNAFGAIYWVNEKPVQLAKNGVALSIVVIPH